MGGVGGVLVAETLTRETFDLEEAFESPAVEDFLNEENWSADVEQLLNDLRLQQTPEQSEDSSQLTEEEQEILDTHNQLRAEVNVPSLSWSSELASTDQDWADELSRRGTFGHSPRSGNRSGAGENIAAGSSVELMLGLWAEEKENYDLSTGQCKGETCGHYTQMIWQNTTELGCGVAPHRIYGKLMIYNYRPPGNVIGQSPL